MFRNPSRKFLIALFIFNMALSIFIGFRVYEGEITKKMFAGRKESQVSTVYALKRMSAYTEEEKRAIGENWRYMQYDGRPNPFPEYEPYEKRP